MVVLQIFHPTWGDPRWRGQTKPCPPCLHALFAQGSNSQGVQACHHEAVGRSPGPLGRADDWGQHMQQTALVLHEMAISSIDFWRKVKLRHLRFHVLSCMPLYLYAQSASLHICTSCVSGCSYRLNLNGVCVVEIYIDTHMQSRFGNIIWTTLDLGIAVCKYKPHKRE